MFTIGENEMREMKVLADLPEGAIETITIKGFANIFCYYIESHRKLISKMPAFWGYYFIVNSIPENYREVEWIQLKGSSFEALINEADKLNPNKRTRFGMYGFLNK